MKTIILCGGVGTRMKEETEFKPKPLIHVGGKPILWHIMKGYEHWGYNRFVLALGYKGDMIKDFFLRSHIFTNDFTMKGATRHIEFHNNTKDDLYMTFADTGLDTETGGRLLRVAKYLEGDDEFMLTYGDGVSDINLNDLVAFHRAQGTMGTITGVHPRSKYGLIRVGANNLCSGFDQKPVMHDYISGGFMVFKKEALSYFSDGEIEDGLVNLSAAGQLSVYRHEGFWKAMDTYKEMQEMNEIWADSRPWAVWEQKPQV